MRIRFLTAFCVILVGCERNPNYQPHQKLNVEHLHVSTEIEVHVIDGCEYLYGPWANATVLTHKGNCKYCLERTK